MGAFFRRVAVLPAVFASTVLLPRSLPFLGCLPWGSLPCSACTLSPVPFLPPFVGATCLSFPRHLFSPPCACFPCFAPLFPVFPAFGMPSFVFFARSCSKVRPGLLSLSLRARGLGALSRAPIYPYLATSSRCSVRDVVLSCRGFRLLLPFPPRVSLSHGRVSALFISCRLTLFSYCSPLSLF